MPFTFGSADITRMTRLEIKRRHAGYTIQQLAWRSGVSVQTIEKHETGVRNSYVPSTVYKLSSVLDAQADYLVRGTRDIWEGGGTLWQKHPRFFDRWEEIIVPTLSTYRQITIPTRSTEYTIQYNWTGTTSTS